MFQEKVPTDLVLESVELLDGSGNSLPGQAGVRRWNSRQAFWRGFRRALRIVGIIFACALPFAFLEPFMFMFWGGSAALLSLVFVGPYFHLRYWGERASFFFVDGECPHCRKTARLTPYLSTEFSAEFTALCPQCGQTCRARSLSV